MTLRLNKPGGQGSSGSGSGDSYSTESLILDDEDDKKKKEYDFGFPGSGDDGEWTSKDDIVYYSVLADIAELQQRGELPTDEKLRDYLNGLVNDGGIKLAHYNALAAHFDLPEIEV